MSPGNRTTLWYASGSVRGVQKVGALVWLYQVAGGVVHVNPLSREPVQTSATMSDALALYPDAFRSAEDAMKWLSEGQPQRKALSEARR